MRQWLFPIIIFLLVAVTLSLIYFNPNLFASRNLISPVVDSSSPITVTITPSRNPLSMISTPIPDLTALTPTPTQPAPTEADQRSGVSSITLTAEKTSSDSAKLVWTIDGQTPSGFVILQSAASAPTFPTRPGDQARSSYDPAARDFTLTGLSGRVYLRVCEFLQTTCGTYSNQITLDF